MSGYVDITPEDFGEIYRHAYVHAHQKLSQSIPVDETGSALNETERRLPDPVATGWILSINKYLKNERE